MTTPLCDLVTLDVTHDDIGVGWAVTYNALVTSVQEVVFGNLVPEADCENFHTDLKTKFPHRDYISTLKHVSITMRCRLHASCL